jgi:hypothetical protein
MTVSILIVGTTLLFDMYCTKVEREIPSHGLTSCQKSSRTFVLDPKTSTLRCCARYYEAVPKTHHLMLFRQFTPWYLQ